MNKKLSILLVIVAVLAIVGGFWLYQLNRAPYMPDMPGLPTDIQNMPQNEQPAPIIETPIIEVPLAP